MSYSIRRTLIPGRELVVRDERTRGIVHSSSRLDDCQIWIDLALEACPCCDGTAGAHHRDCERTPRSRD